VWEKEPAPRLVETRAFAMVQKKGAAEVCVVVLTPTRWLARSSGGSWWWCRVGDGCLHGGTRPHLLLPRPHTFSLHVPHAAVKLFADVQIQTKKTFLRGWCVREANYTISILI